MVRFKIGRAFFIILAGICFSFTSNAAPRAEVIVDSLEASKRILFKFKNFTGYYIAPSSKTEDSFYFLKNFNSSITIIGKNHAQMLAISTRHGVFTNNAIYETGNENFRLKFSGVNFQSRQFLCNSAYSTVDTAKSVVSATDRFETDQLFADNCKEVFGPDYDRMRAEVARASLFSRESPEQNPIVRCLDQSGLHSLAGDFKSSLQEGAAGTHILCSTSKSLQPESSYDSASDRITFYQASKNDGQTDFKYRFIHEKCHSAGYGPDCDGDKLSKKLKTCSATDSNLSNKRIADDEADKITTDIKTNTPITLPAGSPAEVVAAAPINDALQTVQQDFAYGGPVSMATATRHLEDLSNTVMNAAKPVTDTLFAATISQAFAAPPVIADSDAPAPVRRPASFDEPLQATRAPPASTASNFGAVAAPQRNAETRANGNQTVDSIQDPAPRATANFTSGTMLSPNLKPAVLTTTGGNPAANVPILMAEDDFVLKLRSGVYSQQIALLSDPANDEVMRRKRILFVDLHGKQKPSDLVDPLLVFADKKSFLAVRRPRSTELATSL